MTSSRSAGGFFEAPHAMVFVLITLNIAAYALCLNQSGTAAISNEVLFRSGAMYSSAIERHEYWRLVAHGFLHADPLHLATNMFCLALWGGHLERRIGACYFLIVYVCAFIVGGLVSDFTHARAYISVGASGAVSGVLGALLCLWILAKTDLGAKFFVINIGLNVALALSFSRIDWGSHLGGFAAGLICCALLDLLEKVNAFILRCKFPEFVKMNGLIVVAVLMVYLLGAKSIAVVSDREAWLPLLAYFVACFGFIKLLDLVLSVKKGLAIVVAMFAMANVALVPLAFETIRPVLAVACGTHQLQPPSRIDQLFGAVCANASMTVFIVAACAFLLTMLLYWPELHRGINDVGFVGASLRAGRQRRHGI